MKDYEFRLRQIRGELTAASDALSEVFYHLARLEEDIKKTEQK